MTFLSYITWFSSFCDVLLSTYLHPEWLCNMVCNFICLRLYATYRDMISVKVNKIRDIQITSFCFVLKVCFLNYIIVVDVYTISLHWVFRCKNDNYAICSLCIEKGLT